MKKIKKVVFVDMDDGYFYIYVNDKLISTQDCPIDSLLAIIEEMGASGERLSNEDINPAYSTGEELPTKFQDLEMYKGSDWYKDLRYLEL